MQKVGIQLSKTLLFAVAATGLWAILFAPSAAAAVSCDKLASTTGSDGNPGTVALPYRTAQHLSDSLSYGQTGCLRAGTFAFDDLIKVTRPGITLASYPGERATLKGRLWVDADQVTVRDMNLDGRSSFDHSEAVTAADTTFDNVDVTNYHTAICFVLGSSSDYGRAVRTVIENSRIHDCGALPPTNMDHGIYVGAASDVVIRNNWIYDNADRGIQLYPDSRGTRIYRNVIDGNGEGIVISGDGNTASFGNVIENNVISNSRVRWNVESNWPNDVVGWGNVVRNNCLWSSNSSSYYNQNRGILPLREGAEGFTTSGNVVASPQFANASAKDFDLQGNSPCGGRPGAVTLRPVENHVRRGGKVRLRGRATRPNASHVTIQILRHGHWRKFARTRLRPNGKFALRKRLSAPLVVQRARLRAKVPRVGRSKPVAIRIR